MLTSWKINSVAKVVAWKLSVMFQGGGTPVGDGRSTGAGCSPFSQNISGPKLLLSEAHGLSCDQEVVEDLGGQGGLLGEIWSA